MKIYIGLYLLQVGDVDRAHLGQYIGLFLYIHPQHERRTIYWSRANRYGVKLRGYRYSQKVHVVGNVGSAIVQFQCSQIH